jgi:class 3 adenylate cyclase
LRDDGPVNDRLSTTATFLFTDIEGSTRLASRLRDEYPDVLAQHHELLEGVFAAHGGQIVDTQGDAFFVAFARARDAVEAAVDVQRTLAEHAWPDGVTLRVRIGLHTGEANVAGERYVGVSVHRAARISALGHGGQVLVSQTTAQLVEDDIDHLDGLSLRDLGERQLKDIARPVRVYQLDAAGLRKDFPPLKAPRPERRRSRRIALLAVPIAAAGLAAGLFFVLGSGSAPPTVLPDSLVRYDAETLQPTDVIEIGAGPDFVVTAGHYVWVTHYVFVGGIRQAGDHNLTRVDTRTNEAVVVGGGLSPCGMTADPSGDIWVANCFGAKRPGSLVRVGADDLRFKATWPLPPSRTFIYALAYGSGSLWMANPFTDSNAIAQIDARTGKRRTIEMPYPALYLAWSDGYGDLWVSHFADGVTRLHAQTSAMDAIDTGLKAPGVMAVAGDVVWVGDAEVPPTVARVQAVGAPKPRGIRLGPPGSAADVDFIAAGEDAVWATVPDAGQLWRIDQDSNERTPIDVSYTPMGVAAGDGGVWVAVRGS